MPGRASADFMLGWPVRENKTARCSLPTVPSILGVHEAKQQLRPATHVALEELFDRDIEPRTTFDVLGDRRLVFASIADSILLV